MANNTSGYKLADVKRTQHVFTNSGVFNNNNKKAAHNLRRNNLTCYLFVQKTQGKLSPVVLNNKIKYVLYCKAGWVAVEEAVDARESS